MPFPSSSALVSTDWLFEALSLKDSSTSHGTSQGFSTSQDTSTSENSWAQDLVVLDASWHLPNAQRNASDDFLKAHIGNALFFDLDLFSDPHSSLPHMLPKPSDFAHAIGQLGIGDTTPVVVYDTVGLFSAPRVWWMFRVFGHANVRLLEGGLPKWIQEDKPVSKGPSPVRPPRQKTQAFVPSLLALAQNILSDLKGESFHVVDARSTGRFLGRDPEPRPGLRKGHIPGSFNIPYPNVLNHDGTLKPPSELLSLFESQGIDLDKKIITSCGSGVTAALLSLALFEIDRFQGKPERPRALYDGSWAEWGGNDAFPL